MTAPRTADTSVVIPALASWHERHGDARRAVKEITALPAHVLCEAVSVLTRLPGGLVVSPPLAVDLVREAFPGEPLTLDAPAHLAFLSQIGAAQIRGKGVYHALIAATASASGAALVTLDIRAAEIYRRMGNAVEFLS